jgi:NDP-sugar pyrophosphorylase family protein
MSSVLADTPVVILAGGLGTRLRAAVGDRPKGLAAVGDRTFLEIQIGLLRDQGARRFVLCIGHRAEQIREALGNGGELGVRIDYSVSCSALREHCVWHSNSSIRERSSLTATPISTPIIRRSFPNTSSATLAKTYRQP